MPAGRIATTVLGRTGLTVSRMALGALDALDQAAFEHAIRLGINFFISYPGYAREQKAIGRAARHCSRDAVVLAGGSAGASAASVRRDIKSSLSNVRVAHLDIFYLFHVTCDTWPIICAAGGAMAQLVKARQAGLIRHVGATVHNRDLAYAIISSGLIDVVNLRYSLAHPGHEAKVLPEAIKHECGVAAYSALKYGLLVLRPEGWPSRRRVPTAAECYRFVLAHPAVHVAWVGARSIGEIDEAAKAIRPFTPLAPATEGALRRFGRFVHDMRSAGHRRAL
jgi:aryl-alcohol dehydrogenase-like predicted oxidoreductase